MKRYIAAALAASIAAAGCSTASKDIAASYTSPMQFQSYDCEQLSEETARIKARVTEIGGRLDESASNDKTLTAVGMVLFFPTLFFLGGTKQQEAEYARLKGEYDAVQQEAIHKRCAALPAAASAAPIK